MRSGQVAAAFQPLDPLVDGLWRSDVQEAQKFFDGLSVDLNWRFVKQAKPRAKDNPVTNNAKIEMGVGSPIANQD
jgi:hypothetical protein